jgi:hypothetical protein
MDGAVEMYKKRGYDEGYPWTHTAEKEGAVRTSIHFSIIFWGKSYLPPQFMWQFDFPS